MSSRSAYLLENSSNVAHRILVRAECPRKLIIYDDSSGLWSPVTDSKDEDKKFIISCDYLAVSYCQSDFRDKNKLETDVRIICEVRGLSAYWLDFACTGETQEEKNVDLYRIADVFRGAKETLIIIPDVGEGWSKWGNRVWTFPEALLSQKLLCKEGQKRVRETTLHEVANRAHGSGEGGQRLVALYGTSGKDFVRFKDRFKDLCLAIWSRTSSSLVSEADLNDPGQLRALPGERVYALMGFLQYRIEPNLDETEEEAFRRLLLANKLECNILPWEAIETSEEFIIWDVNNNAYTAVVGFADPPPAQPSDDIPLKYIRAAKYSDVDCAVKNSCEKGTRVAILATVDEWLKSTSSEPDDNEQRVFWIYGLAGSGKSTIARTVAKSCDCDNILAATFFCSRDSAECSDIRNIFSTISYQLCLLYKPFKMKVLEH